MIFWNAHNENDLSDKDIHVLFLEVVFKIPELFELFHLLCCSALLKLVSPVSAGEGEGSLIAMIVILSTTKIVLSMLGDMSLWIMMDQV